MLRIVDRGEKQMRKGRGVGQWLQSQYGNLSLLSMLIINRNSVQLQCKKPKFATKSNYQNYGIIAPGRNLLWTLIHIDIVLLKNWNTKTG